MEKLRKQIKESFFNPILHLFPLLLFLLVDAFYGMNLAWEISFPVSLVLLIYVYFIYNRIFIWHLIFTLFFLIICILAGLKVLFINIPFYNELVYETIVVAFLLGYILFRKKFQKLILRIISNLMPMSNNFEELYKVALVFIIVLILYNIAFIAINIVGNNVIIYHQMVKYIYVGTLIFLSIYEIIRVFIIRSKLSREEWWPIVSNQGKIIGSIQHLTSLNDENTYMHPVVRILLIDKSMVLLKKRTSEDIESPDMWDTSLSNHVKMGETIEQCVDRSAEEKYALNNFRFMYLSNYALDHKNEKQYAFLFVSCQQTEYKLNPDFLEQTKWWTQKQIEDNLDEGIFSDNFKIEFKLLLRSGLLETGKCECTCKLRDVIYNQPNVVKKAELN